MQEYKSKYHELCEGKKFGMLLVKRVYRGNKTKQGSYQYMCECDCDCGKKDFVTQIANVWKKLTTSCGCRRDQYKKISGKNNAKFTGFEDIGGRFWYGYLSGAERRGIEFSITKEYVWEIFIKQNKKCALSGVELCFEAGRNSRTTVSIDRIDCKIGYVVGNIQIVHKIINVMKNTLSDEDFIGWCRKVADNAK